MIFRDQDTIWETGPWYRYYILGFLLRSLNISHEWFKNLRGYLASLANKLPKPCQVLIYLTFAAERNCQKFKRVHFKHQTSFHHLYSGLRPNFYSWVKQWQVCMSRLKARCPVSRPDQWCPDCCPVPGRHQISPANKLVLGSAGQCWAVVGSAGQCWLLGPALTITSHNTASSSRVCARNWSYSVQRCTAKYIFIFKRFPYGFPYLEWPLNVSAADVLLWTTTSWLKISAFWTLKSC